MVGGGILFLLLFVALCAPVLAPHDPMEQNLYARLQPPSLDHPLGTDDFGRDILSRMIYGSRISLRIGAASITAALSSGHAVGSVGRILGMGRYVDHALHGSSIGISEYLCWPLRSWL